MAEETISWKDYNPSFIAEIKNRLLMKRTIALFDDLKSAESDLFLEAYPVRSDEGTLAPKVWQSYKDDPETEDVEAWFNSL